MEVKLAWLLNSAFVTISFCADRENLLQRSPSYWPGHMEQFGSQQNTIEVDQIHAWPDPITFFREYAEANKPVLIKGVAKQSPAYQLFTDEYLKSFEGADTEMIYVESEKKENRTKKGSVMSVKEFISTYHAESLYMVNALPKPLRKHVQMPAPIRCEETRDLLSSQVTWFSSGGTKSVVHNDDVDNINCLFRGSKELLFIDYNKNKHFVPIDEPQGGYSSIDVDQVDYTKYPQLRNVDQYVHATMEEGDCVFIPYHWFHQVNSKENKQGQNLAVNVWFRHVFGHRPSDCMKEKDATLDMYNFQDDEDRTNRVNEDIEEGEQEEEEGGNYSEIDMFFNIISDGKQKSLKFAYFVHLMKKNRQLNPTGLQDIDENIVLRMQILFALLDVDENKKIEAKDFKEIYALKHAKKEKINDVIIKEIARIEDLFEDQVEENFQKVREEKIRIQEELKASISKTKKKNEL